MFAELVINNEAPLEGTFHYHIPQDLEQALEIGHLVEVEFGNRLSQGIIIAFSTNAPVEMTKPIIGLIDESPVVVAWQIEMAIWMSAEYLAPLNACLRLFFPPGLTKWSDVIFDINPFWDGSGRLTDRQQKIISLITERGDLKGRQIKKALGKKSGWQASANQLVNRGILRRGTLLDPPGVRPKTEKFVHLEIEKSGFLQAISQLGRNNKLASLLFYLAQLDDPIPEESTVLIETGMSVEVIDQLINSGLVKRLAAESYLVPVNQTAGIDPSIEILLDSLPRPISSFGPQADMLIKKGMARIVDQKPSLALAVTREELIKEVAKLRHAEKYLHVLNLLDYAERPLPIKQVHEESGTTKSQLDRMAKFGIIRFAEVEIWRDSLADKDFVVSTPPTLTNDQENVWQAVKKIMEKPFLGAKPQFIGRKEDTSKTVLLHGVTGSGKTEIYMRAVDFALQRGEKAIVLVPEIALTPQTVQRFAARFPGRVAILHSRLSDGERYDTWKRAREGLFDIVVGPRSALFTPFLAIGVIVIDEEHDDSFKQEPPIPPPYYHARDTAVQIAQLTGATVILGSATPDIVSYHQAQSGRFTLLELPKRVMGHRKRVESQANRLKIGTHYQEITGDPKDALSIPLPPVQIVDLRQELRAGNRSIFSRALVKALNETLEKGEQAILFHNRRGSATFVMCRDCGFVLNCPRCDMPLTYHRPHMKLICHHCGRQEAPRSQCPQCGSKRIKYFGLGTEEVEARVRQQWPEARITRWDSDTTAGKDNHEELLLRFIERESDILVGTQMIAKGLDLPLVTLVGVISADVSLGLPDYRTGERTFQILAQVAGRAGRGLLGGRVIFQTYKPDHYAIQAAAEHDFNSFFIEEIRFRTRHKFPPFRRLAKLVLADPIADRGKREAEKLAKSLLRHIHENALGATEMLGPVPPFFSRIDGRYRWQIILRSPDPVRLLMDFKVPRPWIVDIDPVSTL